MNGKYQVEIEPAGNIGKQFCIPEIISFLGDQVIMKVIRITKAGGEKRVKSDQPDDDESEVKK
jgi:hypothetical protein